MVTADKLVAIKTESFLRDQQVETVAKAAAPALGVAESFLHQPADLPSYNVEIDSLSRSASISNIMDAFAK